MENYFERTREYGKLLLESEKGKILEKAREEFFGNEEAVRSMEEFKAYQTNINESILQNVLTKEEKEIATRNVKELAEELKKNNLIGGLLQAENDFNEFINSQMDVLKATITGKVEEEKSDMRACKGGCKGCCSKK